MNKVNRQGTYTGNTSRSLKDVRESLYHIAGNIDEAIGGGNPLRSMLISSVLSRGISVSKGKITGGGGKGTFDAIDAADVRKTTNVKEPIVGT